MDFRLADEQAIFRDSASRFFAEHYDFRRRAAIVASASGYLEDHWKAFAELGWLALPLSESYGGLGGSPLDTMVLFEQMGRALYVGPYLATVLLGGELLQRAGTPEQKGAVLPRVAEGLVKLAFAYAEPQARYDPWDVETRGAPEAGGYRLEGEKCAVLWGEAADYYIVSARTSGESRDCRGVTLFLVEADRPGLDARHYVTADGARATQLRLDQVRVSADAVVGKLDAAVPDIEWALDHAAAAVCAEAGAIMWAVHETTLDYVKTREQFDRPIGAFQALQHRLVDTYMKCQLAQSLVYEAISALGLADDAARARGVSAAKHQIGRYAREVGEEGVQLHGGIGMTMEYPVGHFLKRLTLINASFGDSDWHLTRYLRVRGSNRP